MGLKRYEFKARPVLIALLAMAFAIGVATRMAAQESPTATATPDFAAAEPLTVTMHPFPSYGPAPLTVGFIVTAGLEAGDEIASYQWNFGDGNVSVRPPQVLFHTYPNPGSYMVTVTVTTRDGRSGIGMGAVIASPPAR